MEDGGFLESIQTSLLNIPDLRDMIAFVLVAGAILIFIKMRFAQQQLKYEELAKQYEALEKELESQQAKHAQELEALTKQHAFEVETLKKHFASSPVTSKTELEESA